MKLYLTLLLLIYSSAFIHAQNNTPANNWIKITLEKILDNQATEVDQSDLELSIQEWINNPIPLNQANSITLSKLFFLTPKEINALFNHLSKYGPFLSIYELQAVEGLDQTVIELLSYFVRVDERKMSDYLSLPALLKKGSHELILQGDRTLQNTKAYQTQNIYAGSAEHLSVRYRFAYSNKLYLGFGIEKDVGEKWNKAGDFQTFHLVYKGKGLLQTLAIGDFHVNMGKGLCMGTSMFNGKSSLVMQSQFYGEGIRPYRSLNESGFMRGFGIGLKKNKFHFDAFASAQPVTASVEYDSLLNEDIIGSIALSGLHRTTSEIAKRKSAWQQTMGAHLKYGAKHFQLGMNYAKKEKSSSLLNQDNIRRLMNPLLNNIVSIDVNYIYKSIILSGEAAKTNLGKKAFVFNALIPLNSKLEMMLIYRSYGSGFENIFSNAWSAQSAVGNEQGLYTAFTFRPKRNQQWSVYADLFQSPKPRYQAALPSKGADYLIDYLHAFSKTLSINFRCRYQQAEKDLPVEQTITKQLRQNTRAQFRIHLSYQLNASWQYQARFEKINAQKTDGKKYQGSMIYHDFNYHPKNTSWSLRARICMFQIEDYAARIYVQEGDVMYNYAQSLLNENGMRFYAMGTYHLSKKMAVQFRIAHTYLPEATSIGSSWDTIEGNKKTDVKIQLRVKF